MSVTTPRNVAIGVEDSETVSVDDSSVAVGQHRRDPEESTHR